MKNKIISILLAVTMLFTLVGCSKQPNAEPANNADPAYKAGTYTGTAAGRNGEVNVEVTFSDTKIESIKVTNHSETEGISDAAINNIPEEVVKAQSLAVDTISGATITSDAILLAIEDAVIQAGGDVNALKQQIKKDTEEAKTEDENCDVVVVGAGAAGTAAALAAVENGANVILLEKTATPMGASTLAGGMFAADSSEQKAKNAVVDKEWLYDQYMDISGGYINSLLVRKIIDESGATVDWLQENGCEMKLADAGTGGSYKHIGMPSTLHGYQEGGTVAINKLIESFESKGGKTYFSTPVTEMLYNSDNEVAGVVAKKSDGTILNVHAKAVIIATGGYGGNSEMLSKYIGEKHTMGEIAQNTGDGIKMAWDAGASECGIDVTQYFWQTFKGDEIKKMSEIAGDDWWALNNFTKYPNLRVNLEGKRFSNETNATLYAVHGAEIHMQPNETEYVIIDSHMLDIIKEKGTAGIEAQYEKWKDDPQFFMEFNEPNDTAESYKAENTPMDYTKVLDPLVGTGVVFKGNTLEELANNMGVDKENFIKSVNQYNGAIKSGKDELFFADTNSLISVDKAPYYAVKFSARNLGTLGGVRINEDIQAVGNDGKPVKGLYVAGADAGGMYGKSYVDFEGGTLGFAYTSGRIAGINAAEYVVK